MDAELRARLDGARERASRFGSPSGAGRGRVVLTATDYLALMTAYDAAVGERDRLQGAYDNLSQEYTRRCGLQAAAEARAARLAALEEAARAYFHRGHSYPEYDKAEHDLRGAVAALDPDRDARSDDDDDDDR